MVFKLEVIGRAGKPYLYRWYLLNLGRFGQFFLHRFVRSDGDLDLHDHPFNFLSLILWGGYWEELIDPYEDRKAVARDGLFERKKPVRVWRYPGTVHYSHAETIHRVVLKDGHYCWTLIWRSKKVRQWGFWVEGEWVRWDKHLGISPDEVKPIQ